MTAPMIKVPDIKFPSNNKLGIPVLDMRHMAVNVVLPFRKWGSISRAQRMEGTYHFYTDDYKFSSLWSNPGQLIDTHCASAVEPNYSTAPDTPLALFLADLYKKRWLARYWQSHAVKIFVDLNVEPEFLEHAFLGVPLGWASYAIRASADDLETGYLETVFLKAKQQARQSQHFTMIVYSGGVAVKEWADKNGVVWFTADYGSTNGAKEGEQ